jgi:uncharacterized protein YxjI
MRYVMKRKPFSWGDHFWIQDEVGQSVFLVNGNVPLMGHQVSFQNPAGQELAFIRQKVLSWGPRYEIFRDGALAAVMTKELFTLFHCKFTVDVPGPDDLQATGSFMEHEYSFARGDATVAAVSRKWFSWVDTYGVDVAGGEDDVLILAATIVIALICQDHRR